MAIDDVVEDTTTLETDEQELDTTDEGTANKVEKSAEVIALEDKNRKLFARAKKAEGFVLVDNKWMKPAKAVQKLETKVEPEAKTGELDETSALWLEVKGVKTDDAEEMKLVEEWRKDSGKNVRQIWGSKIFQAELTALRADREVQNAMPSGTKRANGGGTPSLQAAIAKFEATGELPADFKLRTEVVNAVVDKTNTNKPSWKS